MRKLLLSSNSDFVIEKGLRLLFDDISKIKMAYIITAGNGSQNRGYIERYKEMLDKEGYNFDVLDIEGKTENDLRELLKDKNAIYVEGGNTFYLLKAVRESGFDKVLAEMIDEGAVYIGSSAGSYIACPTIEMSTWKKPGEEKDRFGVTDLTAMNLVPFLVKAHYDPDYRELLKERISQSRYETKVLKDGQAILVEGDNYKLVGDGEEIKI
ncbi:MAG TPA: Type 1 glutamine amidotransferase-like domain-containing protein [Candidatus Moranbacteria bacterium]|nr:Type 1 glutamine amidotransferase-like domain-containing protein [Candidatus Moranbacteria bacterium]